MVNRFIVFLGLILIFIPALFITFDNSLITAKGLEEETVYALIKEGAVLLDANLNPKTSLPLNYFVIIDNETETHYEVTYLDLSGLIEKQSVEIVDYEPKYKFHTAHFTAKNDTFPTNIRLNPDSGSPVIAAIPLNEKAFFYGAKQGEALIAAVGAQWYYVRYSNGADYYGYVYSGHGSAETISENNYLEKIEKPIDLTPSPQSEFKFEWLYIVLLCIPAVIIMFALFVSPKKSEGLPKKP